MKISVLMPVYNEARTIREIIRRVKDSGIVDELIVVDDCSNDGTREILAEESKRSGIKIYYHEKNRGKGAAVRTALKHAIGDIIIIQDADLEYNPKEYLRLIQPILDGTAEVVYGSRFLNSDYHIHCKNFFYLLHFLGNKFLNFLINIIYNVNMTDMETGYKVMKREILKDMPLFARGFEIEPEITAKLIRKGFKIREIPISFFPRSYKEGKKISWIDGIAAVCVLLRYRLKE